MDNYEIFKNKFFVLSETKFEFIVDYFYTAMPTPT